MFDAVLPGGTHTVAIETMAAQNIIGGYPDGTFRPRVNVTRGQMASLLYRALDFPTGDATFTDTTGNTHATGINALATAGVIQGYGDGTFRPSNPITRGQMATMLTRAFDLSAGNATARSGPATPPPETKPPRSCTGRSKVKPATCHGPQPTSSTETRST